MKHKGLIFAGAAAISAFGLAEGVLRLRDKAAARARYRREHWTLARPWEQFDYRSGWELRPGFDSGSIRINRDGFRGPELGERWGKRILCLGGSSTFGPSGEDAPWPRVLQELLNGDDASAPVEVINAGVTGHTTDNMRFRLDKVGEYAPDVTVLLAGDEDLLADNITRYRDNRQRFSSFWHIESQRSIRCHACSLFLETAGCGERKPSPLCYSPDEFVPFNFEYTLRGILEALIRQGTIPVLVTIPSLVPDDPAPLDEMTREKLNLPVWLNEDAPAAFRTVRRSYDTIVRALAKEEEIPLIDAAHAFEVTALPRHALFEDVFRLTARGCRVLGEAVARSLREEGLV